MLIHKFTGITLLTALLVLTACAGTADGSAAPLSSSELGQIFFPQQKATQGSHDVMDALLVGALVVEDACLRLQGSDGTSHLLVWPAGFSLKSASGRAQVLDPAGQPVAQVGDRLNVSGGEIPSEAVADIVSQPLPEMCAGPYWIIGTTVSKGS